MLLAGDEMGRTQRGSNNAYGQDSPLSWVDWENAAEHADLVDFTGALSALRRAHPVFRRRRFFSGLPRPGQHKRPAGHHLADPVRPGNDRGGLAWTATPGRWRCS